MKINSIYLLILLCIFSVNVFAEREARILLESELLDIVSDDSDDSTPFALSLINQGIAVDIIDKNGKSLLMLAAQNDNTELVRLLVEKGADPNYEIKNSNIPDLIGKNVLDFGADTGDTVMIDLLLKSGSKLNTTNDGVSSIAANAYEKGHLDMLRSLLKKGAKISDQTGQYLVVYYILNERNTNSYGLVNVDKDKDFKLIKALDDNGVPLDDETLLQSELITTPAEKTKVEDFMSTYRQKLADGMPDEEIIEIDIDHTKENYNYIYEERVQAPEWKRLLLVIFACIKEILILLSPIIIMVVVFFIVAEVKSGYSTSRRLCNRILSFFRKTYKTFLNWLVSKKHIFIKQHTQTPIIDKGNILEQIVQIIPSDKGWTLDDTINLKVNYLTIEDIINPIRLTNQHERHVREMIWYVRKVEKTNEDKKIVYDTLVSKWKQVNPKLVRSVYKRSLLIILTNYSQQNLQVNQLLKQVKLMAK